MFENLDQDKGKNLTGQIKPPVMGMGTNAPAPKAPPVEDMFAGVKDIGVSSKMPGVAPAAAGIPAALLPKSSGKIWGVIATIVIILIVIGLAIFIAGKFMGVAITDPASWASKFSDLSGLFAKQSGQTMVINNVTPAPETNQNPVEQPSAPQVTPPAAPAVSTTPPAATTTAPVSSSTAISLTASSTLDSDLDGLTDYEEVNVYHTNPYKADSDNDGLTDYQEVKSYHSDPNNPDTDGDGYTDGAEVHNGYNPLGPGKLK